jgi:hypothetical protein
MIWNQSPDGDSVKLDTYACRAEPGVFVTLPSATAKSTIALVDDLSARALRPVRLRYHLPADSCDQPFAVTVLTQIVDRGYALHGPNASFILAFDSAHTTDAEKRMLGECCTKSSLPTARN